MPEDSYKATVLVDRPRIAQRNSVWKRQVSRLSLPALMFLQASTCGNTRKAELIKILRLEAALRIQFDNLQHREPFN